MKLSAERKRSGARVPVKILIVRAICFIIVGVMIVGAASYVIITAGAVEVQEPAPEQALIFSPEDTLVRVGIFYGIDSRTSYRIRSSGKALGFRLFTTTWDNALAEIWSVTQDTDISFCIAGNLKKVSETSTKWTFDKGAQDIIAGGYSLLCEGAYETPQELTAAIEAYTLLSPDTLFIPFYDGAYHVKVGHYTSEEEAQLASDGVFAALSVQLTVASPTDTAITVLNHQTGKILFSFDCGAETGLGCYPYKAEGEENYLKIESGYYWPGVFEVRRYITSDTDGMSLVMISEMEKYVESVVPWEIDSNWSAETVKAFTICVRTFAYANTDKHMRYGINICSDSCCQVSRGHSRVNQTVVDAVASSKGVILTCDGVLITSYYSAVGGGCTVAAHQVWNQQPLKYLVGQMTPWEKYAEHKYGVWEYTITPEELCRIIRAAGYTTISDAVAKVSVDRLCDNSTYLYQLTVTDIHGNTATITRNRNIRSAFAGYVYSGNFTVTREGEEVPQGGVNGLYVITDDGIKTIQNEQTLTVITDTGIKTTTLPNILTVQTSQSTVSCDVLAEARAFVAGAQASTVAEKGSFIISGKGYGHGAGMTQWGAKNLGELGKAYDEIIYTYFPNTLLMHIDEYNQSISS